MRRIPRQTRSRKMVERIVKATGEVIVGVGLENMTTNHVAEAADISIGSLYQYFGHKDELLEALMASLGEQINHDFRLRSVALNINALPLRQVAELAIRYGIESIRQDPLLCELISHWPRLPFDLSLEPLSQFFLVMAQPYFLKNHQDYLIQNLEAKLYVLINATLFTAIHYLFEPTPPIPEDDLIHTLTDMIVGLLEPPESKPMTA